MSATSIGRTTPGKKVDPDRRILGMLAARGS